mmetsp:Transcript_18029/g.33506  ORF Transcript_18029/g.33506 Transcript_18029/m.33506 type:complete len:223 (-) Transcript_18029:86-754(-)
MKLLLAATLVASANAGKYYCAKIEPDSASGAKGYFSMSYSSGINAKFELDLDLSNFEGEASTCTIENGLTYHIHTTWADSSVSSSANAQCGPDYTSGHYDPSLACSSASEDINDRCASLGRTGDNYPCDADDFESGNFAVCEQGDLSGKFGSLTGGDRFFTASENDPWAPIPANYKATDDRANMWSSVVFHCKDDGSRLACADLVEQDEPCDSGNKKLRGGK